MRNDLVNEPTSVDSTSMSNATSTMMPLDTEMRNNLVNEPTSVDSTSMSDNSSIRMTGGGNLLAKLLL